MDIKIEKKDIILDNKGEPVMIQGVDQAVQQIQIALFMKKGSFIYDRKMGSDLTKEIILGENGAETLQAVIYEDLINAFDVDIKVAYIDKRVNGIYAGITVGNKYEKYTAEVIVFE